MIKSIRPNYRVLGPIYKEKLAEVDKIFQKHASEDDLLLFHSWIQEFDGIEIRQIDKDNILVTPKRI
tara:strand:+ start:167 stop:367 length:201 start_codon:yes stop_codon:yes gene_type:complete